MTLCRCGHGRVWHKQAQLSGWQRQRGEKRTTTVRCTFGRNADRHSPVARCRCRGYVPQVAA